MIRTLCLSLCIVLAGCASAPTNEISTGQAVAKRQVPPRYPREAAEAGLQGCVLVTFLILPDGKADKYRIERSEPKGIFDHATLVALNEWRFEQPSRPGRFAYGFEYRLAGKEKAVAPICKVPAYEELNPEAAKS